MSMVVPYIIVGLLVASMVAAIGTIIVVLVKLSIDWWRT